MIKLKCKHCTDTFGKYPSSNRVFCSKKCRVGSRRKTTPCVICKKSFAQRASGARKLCSRECFRTFIRTKPSIKKTQFKKGLTPWNKGKPHLPGALSGHWKGGPVEKQCLFCDGIFTVKPYRKDKAKYCSAKCQLRYEISKGLYPTGERSKWWRGGITTVYDATRGCEKYAEWRDAVFKRDNYTCQNAECGERTGTHNADHIKPFALILLENNIRSIKDALECNELWDIRNGRTLCEECHRRTTTYGHGTMKLLQQYAER